MRRDDVLPCRLYLRHCVLAARGLGSPAALDSFLDSTFLASHVGGSSCVTPSRLYRWACYEHVLFGVWHELAE